MSTDLTFNQALEFHKHSKLIKAKELYEKFLQNNSEHSDALHLLGTGLFLHKSTKHDRVLNDFLKYA